MEGTIAPFASTGWGLAIASWVFGPVWLIGAGLGVSAILRGRPRLGGALLAAAWANPLLAAALWVSVNWLDFGGGPRGSVLAVTVDHMAMWMFAGSVLFIAIGVVFFLVRFLGSLQSGVRA